MQSDGRSHLVEAVECQGGERGCGACAYAAEEQSQRREEVESHAGVADGVCKGSEHHVVGDDDLGPPRREANGGVDRGADTAVPTGIRALA